MKRYVFVDKDNYYVECLENFKMFGNVVARVTKNIENAFVFDNKEYAEWCLKFSGLKDRGYKIKQLRGYER